MQCIRFCISVWFLILLALFYFLHATVCSKIVVKQKINQTHWFVQTREGCQSHESVAIWLIMWYSRQKHTKTPQGDFEID